MASIATCIECGVGLSEERAELGYRYCTEPSCQARHHRGVVVTAVGINKSAESLIVADPDEIRRRGETGEFGTKDSALGLDYRETAAAAPTAPIRPDRADQPPAPPPAIPPRRRTPPRRAWTREQEKIVRLYHDLGLSPRQIAARARDTVPRLGISERLATQILSTAGRR